MLVHWVMQIFQTLEHLNNIKKLYLSKITTSLVSEVLKPREAVKPMVAAVSVPKFQYSLES